MPIEEEISFWGKDNATWHICNTPESFEIEYDSGWCKDCGELLDYYPKYHHKLYGHCDTFRDRKKPCKILDSEREKINDDF